MDDHPRGHSADQYDGTGYALSGKIMLSAIVILFFVVVLMVCLHLYARWYLLRARRRHHLRRSHRRSRNHLVFHDDSTSSASANRGLDAAVLNSLPVFVFKSLAADDDSSPIECAVCLSEFEESETGRRLPKCNHCFHTDCIDMWFHSHSTCPLCRSPVEIGSDPAVIVQIGEPAAASEEPRSSGLCSECECEESSSSSCSSATEDRRKKKPVSFSIEVPRRSESFGRGGAGGDDDSPVSYRSPMSRMLSFKSRMLSSFRSPREAPATPAAGSCSSVNELDLERGKERTQ